MEKFKVRIEKANPNNWYAHMIGETIEVIDHNTVQYYAVNETGLILKSDCTIIDPIPEKVEVSKAGEVWECINWENCGFTKGNKYVEDHLGYIYSENDKKPLSPAMYPYCFRKIEPSTVEGGKSRCCGRCDGVNDICVADRICDEHKTEGCEICYGAREPQSAATEQTAKESEGERYYNDDLSDALKEIETEVLRANTLFPDNFVNQHEAYAVILEEVDELWDEIKKNQRNYDLKAQRKEAVQCAAMMCRLLVELLTPSSPTDKP